MRLRSSARVARLLAACALALPAAGCVVEPAPPAGSAASPETGSVPAAPLPPTHPLVERIKARFPKARGWFGLTAGIRIQVDRDALVPLWETMQHPRALRFDTAGQRLAPRLALRADAPTEVALDGLPGLWVRATPLDALPVAAETSEGVVAYPGAYGRSDLLYKLTPTHVDEYVYVPDAAAPHRFRYRLEAGPAVGELRWTPDAIEVFDTLGVARMRIGGPFARDANGARRDGTIVLRGDVMIVDVNLAGLKFPVLIDPDWTTTGFLNKERFDYQLFVLPNGEVLASAGCTLTRCPTGLGMPACNPVLGTTERYDPAAATWHFAAPMVQPRFAYSGAHLPGGQVMIAGGCIGYQCAGTTDTVEIYDPAFDVWSAGRALISPRAFFSATPLPGGDVLVAGGCDPMGCTASAEIYDVRAQVWRTAASLAAPRGLHKAVQLADGRVMVTGGCDTIGCRHVLDTVEIYDPMSNRWTSGGRMSAARAAHTATVLVNGDVLVAGGCDSVACQPTLASADRWSFRNGTWAATAPLRVARHDHSAEQLADTTVLVAGGCAEPSNCTQTSELYDPDLSSWSPAGDISLGRGYHATTLLNDGRVLFAGGCNNITCLTWAETFHQVAVRDGGAPVAFDLSLAVMPDGGLPVAMGPGPPDLTPPPPAPPGPGWEAEACGCRVGARAPASSGPVFALFAFGLAMLLNGRVRRRRAKRRGRLANEPNG